MSDFKEHRSKITIAPLLLAQGWMFYNKSHIIIFHVLNLNILVTG